MTELELINTFPARYLDARTEIDIGEVYDGGFALIRAAAVFDVKVNYIRRNLNIARVNVLTADGGGQGKSGRLVPVTWFNRAYVKGKVTGGEVYLFYGKVKVNKNGTREILNPLFENVNSLKNLPGIIPVYRAADGISAAQLKLKIRAALKRAEINSALPDPIREKYGLMPLSAAYRVLHAPRDFEEIAAARRAAAMETLPFKIALYGILRGGGEKRERAYGGDIKELERFIALLPFRLTDGQRAAVKDITDDLAGANVMNRLLQGDVGSGKTAVAFCAAYYAVLSGYQTAFMAPTEVLARQHYITAQRLFEMRGVTVTLLTGSQKKEERDTAVFNIRHGVSDIVIGTHALFSGGIAFKDLGLVITDEQHRFGVGQRKLLEDKAGRPDTLVMSATPIPRTLSLMMYGDLNISTLREKPHAGGAVQTNLVGGGKINEMFGFIAKELENGGAAYFVCPRIEDDEDDEDDEFGGESGLVNVKGLYETLKKSVLNKYGIGLLHGKMKEREKAAALAGFAEGKYKVLVSTTVIEVGVDVKTASVMVIYNAERFGLSQLHQLRGRVGRAGQKSWCFLLSASDSPETLARLNVLKSTSDGFALSEYDFSARGAGDIFSEKQHGSGGITYQSFAEAKEIAGHLLEDSECLKALQKAAAEANDLDEITRITLN